MEAKKITQETNNTQQSVRNSNLYIQNVAEYLEEQFAKDRESFLKNAEVTTGYKTLDAQIKQMYPGLYVLGAASSIGKTTFALQLCDQIARSGKRVMYFTLEQSRYDLVNKSIARIMYEKEESTALTVSKIRELEIGKEGEKYQEAIEEYRRYARNITIVECNFDVTIQHIKKKVEEYQQQERKRPIIVIDYLQILKPEGNGMTYREAVDRNLHVLKKLQLDYKLIMLVISSLNRQSYLLPIDYESFKESGGIEYTADVVWGLELSVVEEDGFYGKASDVRKKEIKRAKAESPRKIKLVCVKNRFGIASYECDFLYYPAHDCYKCAEDEDGFATDYKDESPF